MLYSSRALLWATLLRDNLRVDEIKNPRNCVDFRTVGDSYKILKNLIRQQSFFKR